MPDGIRFILIFLLFGIPVFSTLDFISNVFQAQKKKVKLLDLQIKEIEQRLKGK